VANLLFSNCFALLCHLTHDLFIDWETIAKTWRKAWQRRGILWHVLWCGGGMQTSTLFELSLAVLIFLVILLLLWTFDWLRHFGVQSDEQCCNSCEEVREAYKKKGWALTNPDLIDQVYRLFVIVLSWYFLLSFFGLFNMKDYINCTVCSVEYWNVLG
jgi:hypothetical protein